MKPDIKTREDVQLLVDSFYHIVRKDEVIGFLFNDVAKVDWETHLPKMYNFWESLLLGYGTYKGNPMQKHLALNQLEPLKPVHFERWIEIWEHTIDLHFEGEIADGAKKRGRAIKDRIMYKIEHSNSPFV